jgi:hypothetical protein
MPVLRYTYSAKELTVCFQPRLASSRISITTSCDQSSVKAQQQLAGLFAFRG